VLMLETNVRQKLVAHQVMDVLELFDGIHRRAVLLFRAKLGDQLGCLDIAHGPHVVPLAHDVILESIQKVAIDSIVFRV
jgi:hypothetical protein